MGPTLQDCLSRDQFIAGISSEYIQDRPLTVLRRRKMRHCSWRATGNRKASAETNA